MACLLPGNIVIAGDMDWSHICSMQTLCRCPTMLSSGFSSVPPLRPLYLLSFLPHHVNPNAGFSFLPSYLKYCYLSTKPKMKQCSPMLRHLSYPTLHHTPSESLAWLKLTNNLTSYKDDMHEDSLLSWHPGQRQVIHDT